MKISLHFMKSHHATMSAGKSSLQLLDDLIFEIESSLNAQDSAPVVSSANTSTSLDSTAISSIPTIASVDEEKVTLVPIIDPNSSSLDGSIDQATERPKQMKTTAETKPTNIKQKLTKSKSDPVTNSNNNDNEPLSINSIDLRVGIIRTVKRHDTAEKLYVEEIDVGEETYRPIASGLVPYYTLEQMQGRRLIVVCNLKPRNLVGFKSHGMYRI